MHQHKYCKYVHTRAPLCVCSQGAPHGISWVQALPNACQHLLDVVRQRCRRCTCTAGTRVQHMLCTVSSRAWVTLRRRPCKKASQKPWPWVCQWKLQLTKKDFTALTKPPVHRQAFPGKPKAWQGPERQNKSGWRRTRLQARSP